MNRIIKKIPVLCFAIAIGIYIFFKGVNHMVLVFSLINFFIPLVTYQKTDKVIPTNVKFEIAFWGPIAIILLLLNMYDQLAMLLMYCIASHTSLEFMYSNYQINPQINKP